MPNIFLISFARSVAPASIPMICIPWIIVGSMYQLETKTMLIEEAKCSITKADKKKKDFKFYTYKIM